MDTKLYNELILLAMRLVMKYDVFCEQHLMYITTNTAVPKYYTLINTRVQIHTLEEVTHIVRCENFLMINLDELLM